MPVYLLSCNTGQGEASYAQSLSNNLKTTVKAPDEILWYYPDGKVIPMGTTVDGKPDPSKPGNVRIFTPR